MLHVLCRIGRDAYAIPGDLVERILPYAVLKELPGSSHGLTGILNYQGTPVPVVDLCLVLAGVPSRELLHTRILLCSFASSPSGRLGLLAEGVTETRQLDPADFTRAGADGAPCLGDVIPARESLLQRIELPQILPEGLLASLHLAA